MSVRTFEESVRLLNNRVNLEQLQCFTPQDLGGRLDLLQQILDSLGNPETKCRTIHVTGTKGKGSTCYLLNAILHESGNSIGLFTSPHLYSFTERISINGEPISPDDFAALISNVYDQCDPAILQMLTYFELLTLLAFIHFAEKKVDFAIFEVGLGGRLDSTNVCRPEVSIITSISYDHMMQLGPTLADIAAEKCGIIKPNIPVISTVLHPDAQRVVREKAETAGAPLYNLNESFFVRPSKSLSATRSTFQYETVPSNFPMAFVLDDLKLKIPGVHQIRNAAAAISAFLLLDNAFKLEEVREGLQKAFVPIRVEVVRQSTELPTVIFDGAHNRSSIRAFIKTVTEMFPNRRFLLIFGCSQGKDIEGMFAEMSGRFHHIFLTQYSDSGNRHFPSQGLKSIFSLNPDKIPDAEQEEWKKEEDYLEPSVSLNPVIVDTVLTFPIEYEREMAHVSVIEDCKEAFARCLKMAEKDDVICITGSMYLAAELRQYFLS